MNIWALRKKTVSQSNEAPNAPIAQLPIKAFEITCTEPVETSEHIGLNDLFEMTDSQLQQMSPKNTFSRLKVFRPSECLGSDGTAYSAVLNSSEANRISATITSDRASLRANVGLDELLTMDADQVEQLFR